jgi:hypothetical protein
MMCYRSELLLRKAANLYHATLDLLSDFVRTHGGLTDIKSEIKDGCIR